MATLAKNYTPATPVPHAVMSDYQELKFTLHRKLLDRINLETLSLFAGERVRAEIRSAVARLVDGQLPVSRVRTMERATFIFSSRSNALLASPGRNPSRFIPVLILKKMSSGAASFAVSRIRSWSSLCTTVAKRFAAMIGEQDGGRQAASNSGLTVDLNPLPAIDGPEFDPALVVGGWFV